MTGNVGRLQSMSLVIFGWALGVFGLFLLVLGVRLIWLGGSWYYALAGAGFSIAGAYFVLRLAEGIWVFAAVFVGTVAWAFWEAGLDFWPLTARLAVPLGLAFAVCLLAPAFPSIASRPGARRNAWSAAGLIAMVLAAGTVIAYQPQNVIRNPWSPGSVDAKAPEAMPSVGDWRHYGRTLRGTRYAPLDQIRPENVAQLEVAWTFRHHEIHTGEGRDQNTPSLIGDTLYTCSPTNVVHALDADTGMVRWKFDPGATSPVWQRCRGVAYYEPAPAPEAGGDASPASCSARIVLTTIDARLMEIDARTGKPCKQFGNGGIVDLKAGMGDVAQGEYFPTSAPTVAAGVVVVGGWIIDNVETDVPSGVVRAFDADTGALAWVWDVGASASNPGQSTAPHFTRGTPNVWSAPAVDEQLGLIYLPTGNSTPDFWGGHRSDASEEYSSSVVALELATGRERWKFQSVRHDLWDYDVPAQPVLYDMPDGEGGTRPALIQVTKRGQIFVLDRRDGSAIARVVDRPAPRGAARGDWTARTQPYSVGMPAIGTEPLSEARMWGATPLDQLFCRIAFRSVRYEGEFTPHRTDRSLMFPGFYGGMGWGSASVDEGRGLLIVNDVRLGVIMQLVPRANSARYGDKLAAHGSGFAPQHGTPFGVLRTPFLSPIDVPCQEPPYGTISAIDLATREIVWQVPAGTLEDRGPLGLTSALKVPVGMPTRGGPITTRAGLMFFSGTQDNYLRAYDVTSGEELWKGRLPVGSQATPMTYLSPASGRQYVVVTAGGNGKSGEPGDYIIAYALPRHLAVESAAMNKHDVRR